MAPMCPGGGGVGLGDIQLGDEPLVPYIVGLLVVAVVLGGFGLVAMRLLATPNAPLRPDDLWPCAAWGPPTCRRGRPATPASRLGKSLLHPW